MLEYEVTVEEGVQLAKEGDSIKATGPKGELRRVFRHPRIKVTSKDGKIVFSSESDRKKVKAMMGTWRAHLRNMMSGVKSGWECSMKLVYAHFPVKMEVQGNKLIIKNFIGSRSSRIAEILEGVEVKIEGDTLKITGSDKESVGQTAANIEHATIVKGYDKRVFQDGIYKTGKPVPAEGGK